MPVPEAAERHYRRQQGIARIVVGELRRLWATVDMASLDRWWASIADRAFLTVASGQQAAAAGADDYLTAVLREQRIDTTSAAHVSPSRFAGIASDGRQLDTLLYSPVVDAKVTIGAGGSSATAAARGEASLIRIGMTQIQDAGRSAVATSIASHTEVTSYTRMLVPPSCARCAILAGKAYRWNAGFARHEHCDCTAIPSIESVADDLTTDPSAYFRSLSTAEQDRYFTAAGAEAIREGADIGQVVNAGRGMRIAGTPTTGTVRLMPETIIAEAPSRDAAIALLRANGYLN